MLSILISCMMVIKNLQNVHKEFFQAVLMTFIFDIDIDLITCESHCVKLTFDIFFGILTHFC